MKIQTIAIALALVGTAHATSTIQFGSTTVYATNWANGSGVGGSLLAWGMIVDSNSNGFANGQYEFGFNYAGNLAAPYRLTVAGVATDDYLYISPNLMSLTANANDSGEIGLNRITSLASFSYPNNVNAVVNGGDSYQIVWFDVTALGGASSFGQKYGTYTMTSLNTLPNDGTASFNATAAFSGADTLKTMDFALQGVPEPSAVLLGAFGALGLLRRRRN